MTVESPCVGICALNAQSVCTGCGRTLAEIAEWSQASDSRRRRVVELAAARRAELSRPSSPRSS